MGERRLYIGPRRDIARMESVCGSRPGREYDYCVWLDSPYRVSGHVPGIHRSICSDLLYCPSTVAGHMYVPELFCLYLYGGVVWAGVRLELPLCPGHVVVSQSRYALMVRAQVPRHRIEVAVYALGNFWLGTRGHIPRLPGH